jgi:hypothetical protein
MRPPAKDVKDVGLGMPIARSVGQMNWSPLAVSQHVLIFRGHLGRDENCEDAAPVACCLAFSRIPAGGSAQDGFLSLVSDMRSETSF